MELLKNLALAISELEYDYIKEMLQLRRVKMLILLVKDYNKPNAMGTSPLV